LYYAGPDSPLNRAAGLIGNEEPLPALLDQAEAFFGQRGAPAVDCYPEASPDLQALLRHRGYTLGTTLQLMVAALPMALGGPLAGPDDLTAVLARSSVRPKVRLFLARFNCEAISAGAL
jgi:hypothetical protein